MIISSKYDDGATIKHGNILIIDYKYNNVWDEKQQQYMWLYDAIIQLIYLDLTMWSAYSTTWNEKIVILPDCSFDFIILCHDVVSQK